MHALKQHIIRNADELMTTTIPIDSCASDDVWEEAEIFHIENVHPDTYCVSLTFPQWPRTFDQDLFIDLHNFGNQIAPRKSNTFSDWNHPFSVHSGVLVYNETRKKWFRGEIIAKTESTIHVLVKESNRYPEFRAVENFGSPLIQRFVSQISRLPGGKYYSLFQRLEKIVGKYIQRRNMHTCMQMIKEHYAREQRIVEQLKRSHSNMILTKDTVLYNEKKPRKVLRRCVAWKRKWIDVYGHPRLWGNRSDTNKYIPCDKNILWNIAQYLYFPDILGLACADKLRCSQIIHETFIQLYSNRMTQKLNYVISSIEILNADLFLHQRYILDEDVKNQLEHMQHIDFENCSHSEASTVFENIRKISSHMKASSSEIRRILQEKEEKLCIQKVIHSSIRMVKTFV